MAAIPVTNYPSIQAALDALPSGSHLLINGEFTITAPLLTHGKNFRLSGENIYRSSIAGNFDGFLLDYTDPSIFNHEPLIENIWFQNDNANGSCLRVGRWIGGQIRNCLFDCRGTGVDLSDPNFTVGVSHCNFRGHRSGHSIGILGVFHGFSLDITGWDEGVRAYGAGFSLLGGRIEVCGIGLNLGVKNDGSWWILSGANIGGLSMEANDTAIQVAWLCQSEIHGIACMGSSNAPSGMSQYGLKIVGWMNAAEVRNCRFNAQFSQASVYARQNHAYSALTRVVGENSHPTGKMWDLQCTGLELAQCNNPP